MNVTSGWHAAILILALGICQSINLSAQQFTVSGHITDKASGETLIGAGAACGQTGAVTNEYGFYTLTIKGGYNAKGNPVISPMGITAAIQPWNTDDAPDGTATHKPANN